MRRLWPLTECALAVAVVGALLAWHCGGRRAFDALLGRLPIDQRLITAAATLDEAGFGDALANGASARAHDSNGTTALMYAAITGCESRATRLLAAGAEVDAVDRWGFTALMRAAEYNRAAMVQLLLDRGADPSRRNVAGETAADRARLGESTDAMAILAAHERPVTVAGL